MQKMTPLEAHMTKLTVAEAATKVCMWAFFVAEVAICALTYARLILLMVLPQMGLEARWLVGTSMQPTHHAGDLIIVDTDVSVKDLDYGDIIVFARPGDDPDTVCHRVYGFREDGSVITHGDHNHANDTDVTTDASLVGRVIYHIPGAGFVTTFDMATALTAAIACGMVSIVAYWTCRRVGDKCAQLRPTYDAFRANQALAMRMQAQ